jgi:hypothetical protein
MYVLPHMLQLASMHVAFALFANAKARILLLHNYKLKLIQDSQARI